MSELICTCHCGGAMFYRHLHAESCILSREGEEAPKSELETLRDERDRLRKALEDIRDRIGNGALNVNWIKQYAEAALTPATKGERMTHEELVEKLAKPGEYIADELEPWEAHFWHMATGVCTEAGELLDAAKKVVIYRKPIDRANVVEELGDIEFYLEGVRQGLNISRKECLDHNIEKLRKRYHGGKFNEAHAQERADKHGEQDH